MPVVRKPGRQRDEAIGQIARQQQQDDNDLRDQTGVAERKWQAAETRGWVHRSRTITAARRSTHRTRPRSGYRAKRSERTEHCLVRLPRLALPGRRSHIKGMSELTVWYDGACPLCRGEIAMMRRLDTRRAIAFVDVSGVSASSCPIDTADLLARLHASEDGKLLSGAAAFAAMWRAIPLLRPLGLVARSPGVLALLERLYLGFLRVRPRLQRLAGGRASA